MVQIQYKQFLYIFYLLIYKLFVGLENSYFEYASKLENYAEEKFLHSFYTSMYLGSNFEFAERKISTCVRGKSN